MNQRNKYLVTFAAVLGMFLGTAGSAQAINQPTFSVNPSPGYVNEPITLTNTSVQEPGTVHEWDCNFESTETGPPVFEAEQIGTTATCTYSVAGSPSPAQRVTDGSEQMIYDRFVRVYGQTDKPAETSLVSSSTVRLPDELVKFQTPKSQLGVTCQTDGGSQCPAEVVDRSGPNGFGLYTYSVRIMNAKVGPGTVLETTADNGVVNGQVDEDSFNLTVASNANSPFGLVSRDFLVCQPHPKRSGKLQVGASLAYYQSSGNDPSRVTVTLLRKKNTGGYAKVKKVKGQQIDGFSRYFSKSLSALVTLKSTAPTSKKYKVKAKIGSGNALKTKTKTTRITPKKCR